MYLVVHLNYTWFRWCIFKYLHLLPKLELFSLVCCQHLVWIHLELNFELLDYYFMNSYGLQFSNQLNKDFYWFHTVRLSLEKQDMSALLPFSTLGLWTNRSIHLIEFFFSISSLPAWQVILTIDMPEFRHWHIEWQDSVQTKLEI